MEGAAESILASYPSPPPWYKDFTTDASILRQPPSIPERTFTCFGWPRVAVRNERKGIAALPQLDSDTRLFNSVNDLKYEFQRLFDTLVEAILVFLDQLSKTGTPHTNVNSTVQTIIKIQKNLQHILLLLRYWEGKDEIISYLENQLNSRKALLRELQYILQPDTNNADS